MKTTLKIVILATALAITPVLTPQSAIAEGVPEGFTELTKELSPAVVNISTAQNIEVSDIVPLYPEGSPLEGFNDFFNQDNNSGRVSKSLGSGFVIDTAGFVVTNNHVIEGADVIEVIFPNGETYDAELLGRDPSTDLAVLKIDSDQPFPAVDFGDSNILEVGEFTADLYPPESCPRATEPLITVITMISSRPTLRLTEATQADRYLTWTAKLSE